MPVIRSRRRPRERGQAIAEFAIVLPVMWLAVTAVLQLGLLMGAQNGLVAGVREAARRAATDRVNASSQFTRHGSTAGVCNDVLGQLRASLGKDLPGFATASLASSSAVYTWRQNPDGATWYVTVRMSATYRHPLWIPVVSAFFDGLDGVSDQALALSASEETRIENPGQTPPSGGSLVVTCT